MKARVIKEWEMYGITHKVGEIMNIPLHSSVGLPMIRDRDAFLFDNGFIEEIKESTRWKPKNHEKYYHISYDASVTEDCWDNWDVDRGNLRIGNCFQTKEEAERVLEYLKALEVVRGDATSKFTEGCKNCRVYYDSVYNYLAIESNFSDINNGIFGLPYFATEDDAQRSIELHRNEWLTIFGVEEEK